MFFRQYESGSVQGVTVILVARRLELLEQVAKGITESGGKALVRAVDVTDKEQVKAMGKWVREEVGVPTILVNNAGVAYKAEFATQKIENWERMIDLNIKGGCYCISEFLTDMKEMKKGHIVNISSINEKSATSELAVYGGTKQFWAGIFEIYLKILDWSFQMNCHYVVYSNIHRVRKDPFLDNLAHSIPQVGENEEAHCSDCFKTDI